MKLIYFELLGKQENKSIVSMKNLHMIFAKTLCQRFSTFCMIYIFSVNMVQKLINCFLLIAISRKTVLKNNYFNQIFVFAFLNKPNNVK